jgi:outer membrane autotransporter protein
MTTLKFGILTALACAAAAPAAQAANPAFQAFFFTVCQSPTAALATRCGETAGATGNLSGDSESSLNPSQALSNNQSPLSLARSRGELVKEYPATGREEERSLEPGKFGVLFMGRGVWEDQDRRVDIDAERGYSSDSQGFDFGFEGRVSERVALGLLATYEGSAGEFVPDLAGVNFAPVGNAGDIDVRNWGIAAYLTAQLGEGGFFDLAAGYVDSQFEIERRAVFQESGRVVPQTNVATTADADGKQLWATANAGFDWSSGAWTWGLYGNALWAESTQDPYDERDVNGSGLAMRFDLADRSSLLGTIGARTSRAIKTSFGVVVPQLRLDYVREFERDGQDASASFLLDAQRSTFTFAGDEAEESYGVAAFGIVAILPGGWMPYLNVDSIVGAGEMDRYRVSLGVRREL